MRGTRAPMSRSEETLSGTSAVVFLAPLGSRIATRTIAIANLLSKGRCSALGRPGRGQGRGLLLVRLVEQPPAKPGETAGKHLVAEPWQEHRSVSVFASTAVPVQVERQRGDPFRNQLRVEVGQGTLDRLPVVGQLSPPLEILGLAHDAARALEVVLEDA